MERRVLNLTFAIDCICNIDLITRLTDLKNAGGNSGLYWQKWMYSATMLAPRSSLLHSSVKMSVMCISFLLSSSQYALDERMDLA